MKKLYVLLITFLLLTTTWAIAEEVGLLDAYLEDLPSNTSSQQLDSNVFVGKPVDVVADEEVPVTSADSIRVIPSEPQVITVTGKNSTEVVNTFDNDQNQDLNVIELEPDEGDFVAIEANENQSSQTVASTGRNAVTGHAFCQQNPYARECLLSKYLSLCKKDPQSTDCKSQLQKFDNFCGTFPNAYKCKKAKIAAACQKNPEGSACKSFTQRYCQRYPKAIFCKYN